MQGAFPIEGGPGPKELQQGPGGVKPLGGQFHPGWGPAGDIRVETALLSALVSKPTRERPALGGTLSPGACASWQWRCLPQQRAEGLGDMLGQTGQAA